MTLEQKAFRATPTAVAAESMVVLSSPMVVDLQMYRGDTAKFRITVSNPDNSPVDLTGATWDADIRSTAVSPMVITNFDILPVAGDPSSIDVVLDEEKADMLTAGNLVYDIEMRQLGEVVTLITGKITVVQDVSRP